MMKTRNPAGRGFLVFPAWPAVSPMKGGRMASRTLALQPLPQLGPPAESFSFPGGNGDNPSQPSPLPPPTLGPSSSQTLPLLWL